jgi:hypothetical protein
VPKKMITEIGENPAPDIDGIAPYTKGYRDEIR